MSCILCFLDDDFQEKLRLDAQAKTDRFEDALIEYKKIFLDEFNSLQKINTCQDHKHINAIAQECCEKLYNHLLTNKSIDSYFDRLRCIYIDHIRGYIGRAIEEFDKLAKDLGILDAVEDINSYLFFRGRPSETQLNSTRDIFHIPFNKRFLIGNQRYSISGQPLLYLGLSTLDVKAELRMDFSDLDKLYISSFTLKKDTNLRVLGFTNKFPDAYKTIITLTESGSHLDFDDATFFNKSKYMSDFNKFVIVSACSFIRRLDSEGQVFSEEYVLPQLLSEVARKENFDGILFSSTRINKSDCYSNEAYHVNKYKENLALFTELNSNDHDIILMEKFDISLPKTINQRRNISYQNIKDLSSEMILKSNQSNYYRNVDHLSEMTGIGFSVYFEKLMMKDETGVFVKYYDHPLGQLHLDFLHDMMMEVKKHLPK